MLETLDRHKRDSALFQFTTRQLRDFIDPNHLLIKIDGAFDFAELVAPLGEKYSRGSGRPAVHPEAMVRALPISSLYDITFYRRPVHAISENIAFRWFCLMGTDEKVFAHSTIPVFIERIGRDGFAGVLGRRSRQLLRMGLLSRQPYVDSSLVRANLALHDLDPSGLAIKEFREKAIEENGLFALEEEDAAEDGGGEGGRGAAGRAADTSRTARAGSSSPRSISPPGGATPDDPVRRISSPTRTSSPSTGAASSPPAA